MGHHSDDSIETTIWRLSAGARGPGLAGIPEVAPIPECHGLFGVSESGSSIRLAAEADGPSSRLQVSLDDNNRGKIQFLRANDKPTGRKRKQAALSVSKTIIPENPSTIATGGILLCRPLLSFPKSRLVATCAENEVPYVSDPTNFDPTLTVRNAIRSLLYSKSLPRAFQPDSILHLIRSSQSLLRRSEKLTSRLLQAQCHILDLNLRTGTMVIQFSQAQTWANALENILASRIRQIHSIVLRRITELLSPFPANHFGLRSFESFTPRIFPQHNVLSGQESESRSKYLSERKPFTVGGVLFNPLTVVDSTSGASNGTQSREKNVWLLSRQPFMKNRGSTLRIDVPVSQPEKITTPSEKSNPPHAFTPWTLWDDRYWFRFSVVPKPASNFDQSAEPKIDKIPLFIRPFQKSDLVRIRNDPGTLAGEKQGRVQPNPALTSSITRALLISQAPGLTRFTIPLLTLGEPCDSEQTGDTGNEHLLALPTLEHRLSGRNPKGETSCPRKLEILYAKRWWIVEWEWMYKMIDTEDLRLMGKPVQADADMVHTERSR